MTGQLSKLKRDDIIRALRKGSVPNRGIEELAVGLDRFVGAIDDELGYVAQKRGAIKAVRGEYGAGKTFFSRWLQARAQQRGFATAEVQINETETPLYKMETLYRRAVERLRTREWGKGAFRSLLHRWFYQLTQEAAAGQDVSTWTPARLAETVDGLLERRLEEVAQTHPQFPSVLRAYQRAHTMGDRDLADGLLAWLMGLRTVGASIKRAAGVKGELDHFAAAEFLRGLLAILNRAGRPGLVLVLDEVETIQRMRSDVRDKSLNALRQLIDEIDDQRFPGLYLLITGTPSFFNGPYGIKRLEPLRQRLTVDFVGDPRFDNVQAVQVRLLPFDQEKLLEVGRKVRDLYPATDQDRERRIAERVNEATLQALARSVAGELGGKVGVAPRLFLRKLTDLLDRVHEFADFDPAVHWKLKIDVADMAPEEREASGRELGVEDIALELPVRGSDEDGRT